MRTLALLFALTLLPALAPAQTIPGWTVYSSLSGGVTGQLRIPPNYNPAQSYPIVVFLHGAGEIGTNNTSQVNGNIANLVAAADARGFFVYAPQTARPNWGIADDLIAVTQNVGRMTVDYNIDPNRIYVTGLSLGGGAADMCLVEWPMVYAGFVPLAAYNNPPIVTAANAYLAVGRPVWFYHGNTDSVVGAGNTRNSVNYILAAQGHAALTSWASASVPTFRFSFNNLKYTEYNARGHDIWGTAYGESGLYDWLLAQHNEMESLARGESIYVTFTCTDWGAPPDLAQVYHATKIDSQARTWNNAGAGTNTGYNDPRALDNIVAFAQDSTGLQTIVNLKVSKSFYGGDDPLLPTAQRSLSTVFDQFVTQRNWRVTSAEGEVMFSGLIPGRRYDLQIFASVNDTDGTRRYYGRYAAGAASAVFDAAQNLTNFINLNGVVADAGGRLALKITPTSGSRYAIISTVRLTAQPAILGDFSGDGVVDTADYTTWADHYGQAKDACFAAGSYVSPGSIDGADYTTWADHYGQTEQMVVDDETASDE